MAGKLPAAETSFALAWSLWRSAGPAAANPLAEWRLHDLEASLRRDQRAFEAALACVGEERPAGPRWRESVRLRPPDLASARLAFLAVAGQCHSSGPHLNALIEAVDALSLVTNLLAHHAESLPELGDLLKRWQRERSDLLSHSCQSPAQAGTA